MKTTKQKLVDALRCDELSVRKNRTKYGYSLFWINGPSFEEAEIAVDDLNTLLPFTERIHVLNRLLRFNLDKPVVMTKALKEMLQHSGGRNPFAYRNQLDFNECKADRDALLEILRLHGYSEVRATPNRRPPDPRSRIVKAGIKTRFGMVARVSKEEFRSHTLFRVEVPAKMAEVTEYIEETFPQSWQDEAANQLDMIIYHSEESRIIDGVKFDGASYQVRLPK